MFKQIAISLSFIIMLACGGTGTSSDPTPTPTPVPIPNTTVALKYLDVYNKEVSIPFTSNAKTVAPFLNPVWNKWSSFSGYIPPQDGWWDMHFTYITGVEPIGSTTRQVSFTNNGNTTISITNLYGLYIYPQNVNTPPEHFQIPAGGTQQFNVLGLGQDDAKSVGLPGTLGVQYINAFFILESESWDSSMPTSENGTRIYVCVHIDETEQQ